MDKIKKLFKKFNSATPLAIAFIIVGLVLLVLPGITIKTVCLVLGIITLTKGIIKLIGYIKKSEANQGKTRELIGVIFTFAIAFVLVIHPERLLSIIPVLLGFGLFVYGIINILKANKTTLQTITSAIMMVTGLTIVAAPFAFAEALTAILGIALIILGVILIINNNKIIRLKSDIETELRTDENGYTEIDFKDVNE